MATSGGFPPWIFVPRKVVRSALPAEVNVESAPVSSSNFARTCLKAVCGSPVHTATTLMLWPERSGSPEAPPLGAPVVEVGFELLDLLQAAATMATTPTRATIPRRRRPFRMPPLLSLRRVSAGAVVDAESRIRIEEVQSGGVDEELEAVPFPGGGAGAELGHERGGGRLRLLLQRRGPFDTQVAGQFLGVLRHDHRGLHGEVDEHLRAQRFPD